MPFGQYALFDSALMDVWVLRRAADLEIIVTPELYQQLKNEGWEEKQCNGFVVLRKQEADVTTVQDHPTDANYLPDSLNKLEKRPLLRAFHLFGLKMLLNAKRFIID